MKTVNSTTSVRNQPMQKRLMSEVNDILTEAEHMLQTAATQTGDKATELRDLGLEKLKQAKEAMLDMQDVVVAKSKQAARVTDDYVHDHPWQSIGIAALAGVVLSLLLKSR
jgi:ElaB/YqjD/DUF883 family membrane-anchored ribosome-binding protein